MNCMFHLHLSNKISKQKACGPCSIEDCDCLSTAVCLQIPDDLRLLLQCHIDGFWLWSKLLSLYQNTYFQNKGTFIGLI